jgi:hypothetical protein
VRRVLTKKRVGAALSAVVVLAIAAAAFGFFTSTGTGTGSALVGSATSWTVTSGTASGGSLFPGAGSVSLPYTVTNAGNGNQELVAVTPTVAASSAAGFVGDIVSTTAPAGPVAGCLAAWFAATATTPVARPPATSLDVPASGQATGTVSVTLTDESVSQDACEGVSPQINIAAS